MAKRSSWPGSGSGWAWATLAVAWTAAATGCYPGGPTDLSQLDVVVTSYDADFDFVKPKSYALPDSIARLGDPTDPGYVEIPTTYDDLILQQVEAELNAYGWQERIPSPSRNATRCPAAARWRPSATSSARLPRTAAKPPVAS